MAQIDQLPPLRDVINRHNLRAKKELGQNFLLDLNLTARIARTAGTLDEHTIIEVGPGPGGLTRALLSEGAKKVIAIERDARALPALEEIAAAYPNRLHVIEGDALAVDYSTLVDGPTKIVANLPYNIATPLLTSWISNTPWPSFFDSLTLMFQKEVAERVVAKPGDKHYGRLGALLGWRCHANIAFNVDRNAFTPPPKVTSSIVHIAPKGIDDTPSVKSFEHVTRAAFGQRRKMIRQSLKVLSVDLDSLFSTVGLSGTERAENLSVEDYIRIAQYIS